MTELKDRLDYVLVKYNISTHRRVRRLLQTHNVCVNGIRVVQGAFLINIKKDIVSIDGKEIKFIPDVYLMLNKKSGTICSLKEDKLYPLVYENIDKKYKSSDLPGTLHSVGRLDADTEGLLILTTDGDLSFRLCMPEFHVNKTYFIKLRNNISSEEQELYIEKCKKGMEIEAELHADSFFAESSILTFKSSDECFLTIQEGKFHQVKRMIKALGNEVIYLKRIKMGSLELDESLQCGEYRELTDEEVAYLKNS